MQIVGVLLWWNPIREICYQWQIIQVMIQTINTVSFNVDLLQLTIHSSPVCIITTRTSLRLTVLRTRSILLWMLFLSFSLLEMLVFPPPSLEFFQSLQPIELFFLYLTGDQKTTDSSLEETESFQKKLHIKLLEHFFLAVNSFLYFSPSLTKPTEGAYFEEQISKITEDIEARKVIIFIIFVLENHLCYAWMGHLDTLHWAHGTTQLLGGRGGK